ncbi:Aminodeoxychorismate synthase, chloroplastic [Porphyridium purpureum]|uniref:aminodeoxychorismate synthase n=1 Tax=Porphyridium purpureum TaxID=35688 RepID=A0A5J4YJH0_PORPP|nr:Aminodeoxychorismate synthase, chloroplastic [Porphyridium purpureum]|eukprot:POR3301..scf261_15
MRQEDERGACADGSAELPTRTLLLDNYDSYTYNLYHMLGHVNGVAPVVVRNDAFGGCLRAAWDALGPFDNVVISPGPGRPDRVEDFGMCAQVWDLCAKDSHGPVPVLGVCLGHQGLCVAFGAQVQLSTEGPVHGRLSRLTVADEGDCSGTDSALLFDGIQPHGEQVVRYHSLAAVPHTIMPPLKITAWSYETQGPGGWEQAPGTVMAVQHTSLPFFGVQFHPESIGTRCGLRLLNNFRLISTRLRQNSRLDVNLGQRLEPRQSTGALQKSHMNGSAQDSPLAHQAGDSLSCSHSNSRSSSSCGDRSLHTRVSALRSTTNSHFDWDTQVVFESLFGECNECPEGAPTSEHFIPSFWLDSASSDPAHGARFSYMGRADGDYAELVSYNVDDRSVTVQVPQKQSSPSHEQLFDTKQTFICRAGFFDFLETRIALKCENMDRKLYDRQGGFWAFEKETRLPFDFIGGYVGYLGYELKQESVVMDLDDSSNRSRNRHRSSDPDAALIFADRFLAFDALSKDVYIVCMGRDERDFEWIDQVERVLEQLRGKKPKSRRSNTKKLSVPEVLFVPERSCEEYMDDIAACQRKITEGESYEICLTNRLRAECVIADAFDLYAHLRDANPAPYSCFLRVQPDLSVCCSSPERFLKIAVSGQVTSRPIKGTARRAPSCPSEDADLRRNLESSVKDRAENLMIVDLVRNDLGRVCELASVQVPQLMHIESFATVHQMVSTISGQLPASDGAAVRCIRAAFPMGSMTGAPKLRTLEIIDSLEHSARGIYSGCIGYFSLNNAAELNVVIRTAVVRSRSVEIGVGGAITALSEAASEYDEILLKGKVLVACVNEVLGHKRGVEADDDVRSTATGADIPGSRQKTSAVVAVAVDGARDAKDQSEQESGTTPAWYLPQQSDSKSHSVPRRVAVADWVQ